jgi:hypothetical protein
MNPAPYLVLSRGGFGWSGYARLRQGPDHLLLVESNGFTENYKRFFFAEIQALTVRRTATGRVWNGIWGGLFLMFALIALQFSDVEAVVLWFLTAVFLGALLANFAFGPTCVCHVRTAVQTEKLTSITRMKRAEKVLAQIRPLLAAAQGTLTPEETTSRLLALAGPYAFPPVADNPHAPPVIY